MFGTGKYKWLNTLLGVICFLLIAYLIKVMRPKTPTSTKSKWSGGSGKGMFGKGGKSNPFGGLGGKKMGGKMRK